MKKVLQAAITVAMSTMLMTGCAVKNDDNIGQKVAKHTVNSPLYALVAGGVLVGGAVNVIGYAIGADKKSTVNQKTEKN